MNNLTKILVAGTIILATLMPPKSYGEENSELPYSEISTYDADTKKLERTFLVNDKVNPGIDIKIYGDIKVKDELGNVIL